MTSYLINISAVLSAVAIFVLYETGAMATHNAFFLAAALFVFYTAYQLIQREGMPLADAVRSLVSNPDSYPRQTAYWAYVLAAGTGLFVVGQTLVTSVA